MFIVISNHVFITKRFLALSILAGFGRLQNTMALISLIAAAQLSGFSVLQGSLISGGLFLSAALSAIFKGRLVDRRGPQLVSRQALAVGFLFFLLLGAFLFCSWEAALFISLLLGTVRLNPGALQQALWSEQEIESRHLSRLLSWETTVGFLAQISGPALATGALWLAGGYFALALTGVIAASAMLAWGLLAPRPEAKDNYQQHSGLIKPLLPVILAIFPLAFSTGLLQNLLLNTNQQGPLLVVIYTLGATLGGIIFFRRPFPQRGQRLTLGLSPLLLLSLVVGTAQPAVLAPGLLLSGFWAAAAFLVVSLNINRSRPQGRSNEAFSLPLMIAPLGVSLGIICAGIITQLAPDHWPALAAALAVTGAMLASSAQSSGFKRWLIK